MVFIDCFFLRGKVSEEEEKVTTENKRLQTVRNALGFTQAQLAEKMQYTTNYIGKIECGAQRVNAQFLNKLCLAIPQVNRAYVVCGSGPPLRKLPPSSAESKLAAAKDYLLDLFLSLPPEKQVELANLAKELESAVKSASRPPQN